MKFLPTMNDIFDDLFYDPFKNYTTVNAMRTDITEQDDHYLLDMELPGFKKENIQLELKDGYLYINADRDDNSEEKDDEGHIIRRERYSGSCSRSFYVGDVQKEDIKASFDNGELKITIPKDTVKQVEEKKYISID